MLNCCDEIGPEIPGRRLLCAYKNFESLKIHYPLRDVIADRYCPNDEFYYWNKNGRLRRVEVSNGSIWEHILEDGIPTIYQKRIR